MNRRETIFCALTAAFMLLLSGCGASSDGISFTEKEVPVISGEQEMGTITLRFYEDMPNVDYVNLGEWYNKFMELSLDEEKPKMTFKKSLSGKYNYSDPYGKAVIDVDKDTIFSKDMSAFTNLMSIFQAGIDNIYFDHYLYTRIGDVEKAGDGSYTYDLGKYNIDIRYDKSGVYIPQSTVSDIFSSLGYNISLYDGNALYLNTNLMIGLSTDVSKDFVAENMKTLDADGMRPADMAEYAYNTLCFSLDNFYGYPGRARLNDYLAEKGLDKALQEYGDIGRKTREYLMSRDFAEYVLGNYLLTYLLWDKGHTYFYMFNDIEDLSPMLYERIKYDINEINDQIDELDADIIASDSLMQRLLELRKKSFGEELYVKKGDTAVFSADSFNDYDESVWKSIYQDGADERKLEELSKVDSTIALYFALKDAARDPEIKNFIVDVSINPGGSADMVCMFAGLVTGQRTIPFTYEDVDTKRVITQYYECDLNLDGVFDELDELGAYDLNIGVITSGYSFSSANCFTSLLKDAGYPVMGQRSGGGGCAVQMLTTGEGYVYGLSSFRARLLDKDHKPVDDGIPVDYELDESSLYDIDKLSEMMNDYYSEK